MAGTGAMNWLWRPVGSARDIGLGDIVLASALSAWAVLMVTGAFPGSTDRGGVAAAVCVLAMTAPVVFARRAALTAAAVVAAGTVLNEALIGPMVRCGPGLPAALIVAYFAGTRLRWELLAAAAAACAVDVGFQAWYDPKLGPGFMTL